MNGNNIIEALRNHAGEPADNNDGDYWVPDLDNINNWGNNDGNVNNNDAWVNVETGNAPPWP